MTEYQLVESDQTVYRDGTIKLHGEAGFEGMRKAGRLAAEILDELTDFVQPGVTTGAIDDKARTMMLDAGAVPAPGGTCFEFELRELELRPYSLAASSAISP